MDCNKNCKGCHKIDMNNPECTNYKLFKAIYGQNAKMPQTDKDYIDNN
jgi:hypothetical protein